MFNLILYIMKNNLAIALLLSFFLLSCEDDHDDCHECHIAIEECCGLDEPHDHTELEGDIGEFCGDALADIEANGYVLEEDLIVGNDTIPAGTYTASQVHCEEHAH